jgi:hypothetical protein
LILGANLALFLAGVQLCWAYFALLQPGYVQTAMANVGGDISAAESSPADYSDNTKLI